MPKPTREESNEGIRHAVERSSISVVGGELTNEEINRLLRGEPKREIIRTRKAKPLTDSQRSRVIELMNTKNLTWAEAEKEVRANKSRKPTTTEIMNQRIRAAKGTTVEVQDTEKKSKPNLREELESLRKQVEDLKGGENGQP